jgi:hypothetical protein
MDLPIWDIEQWVSVVRPLSPQTFNPSPGTCEHVTSYAKELFGYD